MWKQPKFKRTYSCNTNYEVNHKVSKTITKHGSLSKGLLFCNEARKRIKGKEQGLSNAESNNFEQNIRKYIEWQDDQVLSVRLSNVTFSEKEIKYDGICRVKLQTTAEAKLEHKKRKQVK